MISPEMAPHGSPDSRSKMYKVELRLVYLGWIVMQLVVYV
jgi:hypothetical protein